MRRLIKRRGKSGLLALNKTWPEAKAWVAARAGKTQKVEHTEGVLRQFLVEPFVPHPDGTEYYININSVRDVSHPRLNISIMRPDAFELFGDAEAIALLVSKCMAGGVGLFKVESIKRRFTSSGPMNVSWVQKEKA